VQGSLLNYITANINCGLTYGEERVFFNLLASIITKASARQYVQESFEKTLKFRTGIATNIGFVADDVSGGKNLY
jgi:hypothetical protein